MKKNTKKSTKPKINPMPVLAGVVLLAALAVTLLPKLIGNGKNASPESPSAVNRSDVVIETSAIGTQASYFDYNADGTTVQVFAVRASDGSVRVALNTCQVCNGSPYAYFVQEGDDFVCQNCMNRFASTDVGKVSGGCNPVPVAENVYTEQAGVVTIPAAFLEGNAYRFTNWKKF